MKKTLGFTLIEVLVASTIVIILTTIGATSYARAGKSSRDAKRKADLEVVRQALILYRTDNGTYPSGTITLSPSNSLYTTLSDYLSEPYPADPRTPSQNYSFVGTGGTTFSLTATLENDGDPEYPTYTLTNP